MPCSPQPVRTILATQPSTTWSETYCSRCSKNAGPDNEETTSPDISPTARTRRSNGRHADCLRTNQDRRYEHGRCAGEAQADCLPSQGEARWESEGLASRVLLIARFSGDVAELTRAYDRAHEMIMVAGVSGGFIYGEVNHVATTRPVSAHP